MRGQEVGRGRIDRGGLLRLEIGIVLHRGEETHRAVGIVTGARGDADADRVGLEFLRPREARQRELGFGQRQRAGFRIGHHVGHDAADKVGLACLFLADLGVAGDDVAHFVRQHRGELGIVIGERDQAARDVKLAGRQRKGVDRRRIEHRDFVVQIRTFRGRDQAFDGLLDHHLQPRVVIDAAIGRKDPLMLAQHRGRHGGIGLFGRSVFPAACGERDGVDAVQAASSSAATATLMLPEPEACLSPRFTALPKSLRQFLAPFPCAHLAFRRSPPIAQRNVSSDRPLRSAPAAPPPSTGRCRRRRAPRHSRGPGPVGRPDSSHQDPPP